MLDVSIRAGVLRLLDRLRRTAGSGVLMITHDLSTAARFADRIAVMYLGRIVEEGPAREVVRDPQHPYTKALLSVVPKRDPRNDPTPRSWRASRRTRSTCRRGAGSIRDAPSRRTAAEIDPELRPARTGPHVRRASSWASDGFESPHDPVGPRLRSGECARARDVTRRVATRRGSVQTAVSRSAVAVSGAKNANTPRRCSRT